MRHHIFLSYDHDDSDLMSVLHNRFRNAELRVWTDEQIELGAPSWKTEVEAAIRDTGCLVCICTHASKNSRWVNEELNYADHFGKPIFLTLWSGDQWNSIPFGYSDNQWIDVRDPDHRDSKTEKLIGKIRMRLGVLNTLTPILPPPVRDLLPSPFEWCEIPAGSVKLEDATAVGGTKGGFHYVERYLIGKYPITNAQYRVFIHAQDGYLNESWWDYSEDAKTWRDGRLQIPSVDGDDYFPCTGNLNWFDAVAFCRWLTARMSPKFTLAVNGIDFQITLPTEQQWQHAAIGDTGWKYPWGNNIDKAYCNYGDYVGALTSVTSYPLGASPYGVLDMCGNSCEWCLTQWNIDTNVLTGYRRRAIRGGACGCSTEQVLASFRFSEWPRIRGPKYGFRIAYSAIH